LGAWFLLVGTDYLVTRQYHDGADLLLVIAVFDLGLDPGLTVLGRRNSREK
jgi:hypothetical protein